MNTSIYKRQWDIQSFTDPGKKPYKISERLDGGWECSCPAWTRHMPRGDCKHIDKVGLALQRPPAAPASFLPTNRHRRSHRRLQAPGAPKQQLHRQLPPRNYLRGLHHPTPRQARPCRGRCDRRRHANQHEHRSDL